MDRSSLTAVQYRTKGKIHICSSEVLRCPQEVSKARRYCTEGKMRQREPQETADVHVINSDIMQHHNVVLSSKLLSCDYTLLLVNPVS